MKIITTIVICFVSNLCLAQIGIESDDSLNYYLQELEVDGQIDYLESRMEAAFYNDPPAMYNLVYHYDSIVMKHQLEDLRANVYNFKGNAHYTNQEFGLALEEYLKAQTLIEQGQKGLGALSLYNNLAACYRFTNESERAIEYYKLALDQAIIDKDSVIIAQVNNNLGMQLMEAGELETSAPYLNEAIEMYQAIGSKIYEGISRLTRANLFNELKQYPKALEDYQLAMDFVPESAAPIVHAASYAGMGAINRKLENYNLSTRQLLTSLQKAEAIQHTEQIKESNRELSDLYAATGNHLKSLQYYKEYTKAKDSLFTTEQQQILTDAISKYETEKKNQEISLLNIDKELAATKLGAARRQAYGLLFGLLLISGLLFGVFRLYKKTQSQNAIISNSLSEKELLLREIHHRVKNNLQFISSLLRLQSDHVDDPTALDALQQGHDRVRSMALIHQNLYKEDNLTGVDTKEYFTKLITGLFKSNNIHDNRIRLDLDISELNLDVDTIVPIGLITNELITNSLKYAYPDDRQGVIAVQLKEEKENLCLTIEDDGIGMTDKQYDSLGSSFGYKLIRALVEQMDGEIEIDHSQGMSTLITIGEYNAV